MLVTLTMDSLRKRIIIRFIWWYTYVDMRYMLFTVYDDRESYELYLEAKLNS